jgi:hypothetical protein
VRRILSLALACLLFAGIIILVGHKYEERARVRSEHDACVRYNKLAFAVNLFHGTVFGFMKQAQAVRRREAELLRTSPSQRAQRIRTSDLKAVAAYQVLIDGIRTTPYEKGCVVPQVKKAHRK